MISEEYGRGYQTLVNDASKFYLFFTKRDEEPHRIRWSLTGTLTGSFSAITNTTCCFLKTTILQEMNKKKSFNQSVSELW